MTKARKEALRMMLECAIQDMQSLFNGNYDVEEEFTYDDCYAVYDIVFKRFKLEE